ncbi:MAG: hypothetical protein HQL80_12460 [Magnetococcales bacterium]|nr:hypothetical protein [Magnetococcales bacterium]
MFSISSPELLYFYHRVEKPAPRQVVEPSMGVRSRTADRSSQESRHQPDGEKTDFSAVFSKVLNSSQG